MKDYNQVQKQIEILEQMLIRFKKEIHEVERYSPIGLNIEKQHNQVEKDIETLKWVLADGEQSNNSHSNSDQIGAIDSTSVSELLQTTINGRHLLNQILFPISNQFNISPEKIPIDLVVKIIQAVKSNNL